MRSACTTGVLSAGSIQKASTMGFGRRALLPFSAFAKALFSHGTNSAFGEFRLGLHLALLMRDCIPGQVKNAAKIAKGAKLSVGQIRAFLHSEKLSTSALQPFISSISDASAALALSLEFANEIGDKADANNLVSARLMEIKERLFFQFADKAGFRAKSGDLPDWALRFLQALKNDDSCIKAGTDYDYSRDALLHFANLELLDVALGNSRKIFSFGSKADLSQRWTALSEFLTRYFLSLLKTRRIHSPDACTFAISNMKFSHKADLARVAYALWTHFKRPDWAGLADGERQKPFNALLAKNMALSKGLAKAVAGYSFVKQEDKSRFLEFLRMAQSASLTTAGVQPASTAHSKVWPAVLRWLYRLLNWFRSSA